jgi:hypothetical protein
MIVFPVTMVIAQATPSPVPSAAIASDAVVMARAKDWLHQVQIGRIDRSQLNAKMNASLTDAMLASVSSKIAPLGNPTDFTLLQKETVDQLAVYIYKAQFPSLAIYETFALDSDGKIAGLLLSPQGPSSP